MKVVAIIPARYASTRYPGKPLELIGNQSMIERVYRQASLCKQVHDVLVATDDKRIFDHVSSWGGKVVITSTEHVSGTDRCLEAYLLHGCNHEIVLNVQGDEPFLDPNAITQLIELFSDPDCTIGTLVRKIDTEEDLLNPSCVKAVLGKNNYALYFTRNPAPYIRQHEKNEWLSKHTFYAHIGIYGFRVQTLKQVCSLAPSALEKAESLEQLRWLENGYNVRAAVTSYHSFGIDTPEDMVKARKKV